MGVVDSCLKREVTSETVDHHVAQGEGAYSMKQELTSETVNIRFHKVVGGVDSWPKQEVTSETVNIRFAYYAQGGARMAE